MGWPDGWGKKICGRLWQPRFDPWHPHRGRGALNPASCPLTGACKARIYFSVQMCMFPCSFSHWKSALKQWYPISQNQFRQKLLMRATAPGEVWEQDRPVFWICLSGITPHCVWKAAVLTTQHQPHLQYDLPHYTKKVFLLVVFLRRGFAMDLKLACV